MRDPHQSHWIWPRFGSYIVATPDWKFGWNRYYEGAPWQITIGAFVVCGRRCFGVQWRTPHTPIGWAARAAAEGEET